MTGDAPRILVSAGEPSGDLHGAEVVAALRARWPSATIDGVGGPRMAAAGAGILFPMERLSAMGAVSGGSDSLAPQKGTAWETSGNIAAKKNSRFCLSI